MKNESKANGRRHRKSSLPIAILLGVSLMLALPTASAHGSSDHGTITIHDEEDGPDTRVVSCEFWVRGHDISDSNGSIYAAHEIDLGPAAHSHRIASWEGEPDENGTFTFEVGPLTVHESDEETLITASMGDNLTHRAASVTVDYTACPEEPEEPEPFECPAVDLAVEARGDGSIFLAASGLVQNASLMRSSGGEAEEIALLGADDAVFVDTDTEVGTTYTYELVIEGEPCAVVEVTAIPVFPTLLAGGAAVGMSMLGYAALRRRQ